MTDPNPHDEIARIEARLEQLAGIAERCRKIILASKVAIGIGVAMLLAMTFGMFASGELLIFSLAAVLGGIVLLGSNVSTLRQTTEAMTNAETLRAHLIDGIDLRVVSDRANLG
jgi:hypothetical protein